MTPPQKKPRLCSSCGASIPSRKRICPSCGKKLESTAKFACPSCGGLIPKSSKKCPVCNVDLPGKPSKPKSKPSEEIVDQPAADLKGVEPTKVEEDKKLSGEAAVPVTPHEAVSEEESTSKAGDAGSTDSRPCPFCGAIISKDLQECPQCKASLVETKPLEEAAVLAAASSEIRPSEDSAPTPIKVDSQPIRPTRQRKLKAAKVTTIPAASQTNAYGRINGVGHVNGLGKVNGTGATNGGAFVNGTGVSTGLEAQSRKSSAKRKSSLIRWQFLAVVLAIVIIIPAFIFLSYSQEKSPVSVDGKFADWASVQKFGMYTSAGSAPINVDEWAVSHQGARVFLYMKAQADIMGTTNVSSFCLFIDNDNSPSTGYAVSGIGADYLVELDGWNGSVRASSVSRYGSQTDHYDWNSWVGLSSTVASVAGTQLEASAELPEVFGSNAKLILLSKDNFDRSAISYPMPQTGGLLVIKQEPGVGIQGDGIVPSASSVAILKLTLSCQGAGGSVDNIVPVVSGAALSFNFQSISLSSGKEKVINVSVDTSSSVPGTFVEALVSASAVNSSFAGVKVVGIPAKAYVTAAPVAIRIDGAFADWAGKMTPDSDPVPVGNENIDIKAVGEVNSTASSSFYVSVFGDMLGGSHVPVTVAKPSNGGGGGIVIPTKKTGEDVLRIYIDSDLSSGTGYVKAAGSKVIGADYMVEVKGVDGVARPGTLYAYSSGQWSAVSGASVLAENDRQQIELSVSSYTISGSSSIDFIVETTDWKTRGDVATSVPSSSRSLSREAFTLAGIDAWMVDGSTTSPYATAMSYQRKLFYDGINFWSFFFDGVNTVHKYSVDDGQTWTYSGSVFRTAGVNETSIWYDPSTSTVYAVGDTSTATNRVYVQVGSVDAAAHTISWAANDYGPKISTVALAGKNTYISKDTNGYLWVLSSNCTAVGAYQLSAFRSSAANNATAWVFSGQMLPSAQGMDNVKGSIVPAGSGSDVWAIYAYNGAVAAKKYAAGAWRAQSAIYGGGSSGANTDNSPPSVVVDGKGVVHVVYGTGHRSGGISTPVTYYSHNNTALTTFTLGVSLDPLITNSVGDYYPTISLDSSTGNLYVLWLQGSTSSAAKTVMCTEWISGAWSNMTIGPQTSFTKQYLTSIYSASDRSSVCWQWTQNLTLPIEVVYDNLNIPEFGHLILPMIGFIVIFAVCGRGSRRKEEGRIHPRGDDM